MNSADRCGSGGFETAAARRRSRTQDTCVEWNLGECVDEPLRCSCWRAAWEENTLCRAGGKQRRKLRAFLLISYPRGNQRVKTYSDLSWFELLEMLRHLFFAAELDLTLGTFIIYVLRRLFLLAGQYLPCCLFGIRGGLA